MKKYSLLIVLLFILMQAKGQYSEVTSKNIIELNLTGAFSEPQAEISGLTWYKDWLILLPQYPSRFGNNYGNLFYLTKEEIQDYLDEKIQELIPHPIEIQADDDYRDINGYQGFEAIVFSEKYAFLTIESESEKMLGYLLRATIDESNKKILIESDNMQKLEPQTSIYNACYETICIYQKNIYVVYEANGKNVNEEPKALLFDFNLNSLGFVPMFSVEYRITDATDLQKGHGWMINYFWPGDAKSYKPSKDKIDLSTEKSSYDSLPIERLIPFQVVKDRIELSAEAPIYLTLQDDGNSRNWEGIVRYKDGFILATDKFPRTILGFVK